MYLLNIKAREKHLSLEHQIKKWDPSQDMSRSAVFEREVRAAQGVKSWQDIQKSLSNIEIVEGVPHSTTFQARYGEEIATLLDAVRTDMLEQLKDAGALKVLQTQYMVLLLQANYLRVLKQGSLTADKDEEVIDMPETARILCEMMLSDEGCKELAEIQRIMMEWRNKWHG